MDIWDVYGMHNLTQPFSPDMAKLDFYDAVKSKFKEYLFQLPVFEGNPESKEVNTRYREINKSCASILRAIHLYLCGHPNKAYEKVSSVMNNLLGYFRVLSDFSKNHLTKKIDVLYRLRKSSMHAMKREDMFHIPYDKRQQLIGYRYSIPGIPCLYLGSSSYVCWEEVSRPPFHEVQISGFQIKDKSFSVLDLCTTALYFRNIYDYRREREPGWENSEEFLTVFCPAAKAFASCWPIIAACSFKTRHPDCPFHEEYIIPQLVMQWIHETKAFDCVSYLSTKNQVHFSSPAILRNYAFLPSDVELHGTYSHKLREYFSVSLPTNWTLCESVYNASTRDRTRGAAINGYGGNQVIIDGESVFYDQTAFMRIEEVVGLRSFKDVLDDDPL